MGYKRIAFSSTVPLSDEGVRKKNKVVDDFSHFFEELAEIGSALWQMGTTKRPDEKS